MFEYQQQVRTGRPSQDTTLDYWKFDARALLEVVNGAQGYVTCVGYAKSCGRRCKRRLAWHNEQHAEYLCSRLANGIEDATQRAKLLQEMAGRLLCPKDHAWQVEQVSRSWYHTVEWYLKDSNRVVRLEAARKAAAIEREVKDRRTQQALEIEAASRRQRDLEAAFHAAMVANATANHPTTLEREDSGYATSDSREDEDFPESIVEQESEEDEPPRTDVKQEPVEAASVSASVPDAIIPSTDTSYQIVSIEEAGSCKFEALKAAPQPTKTKAETSPVATEVKVESVVVPALPRVSNEDFLASIEMLQQTAISEKSSPMPIKTEQPSVQIITVPRVSNDDFLASMESLQAPREMQAPAIEAASLALAENDQSSSIVDSQAMVPPASVSARPEPASGACLPDFKAEPAHLLFGAIMWMSIHFLPPLL